MAGGFPKVESLPQCRCPKLNLIKISFTIADAIVVGTQESPIPSATNCGRGQLARTGRGLAARALASVPIVVFINLI